MPELPSSKPRWDLEQGIDRGAVSLGSFSLPRTLVPLPLLARSISVGPAAPPLPTTALERFDSFECVFLCVSFPLWFLLLPGHL